MRSDPLLLSARVKSVTKTRPSATDGPANPPLIGVRHWIVKPSLGNSSSMPDSFQTPSRLLPRHSGQSSAYRHRAVMARVRAKIGRVSLFLLTYPSPL